MCLRGTIAGFIVYLSVTALPAQADGGVRFDTPSGFPVPRFVSLKQTETNCRSGPSFDHPVRFVFKRAGAPVLVIAESVDHWRKIRDSSGDACWAHETTLKAQSHVLVLAAAELRRKPDETAAVSGRLGEGVFARIVSRRDGWILVTADDARGWIASNAVWGGEIAGRPAWRN